MADNNTQCMYVHWTHVRGKLVDFIPMLVNWTLCDCVCSIHGHIRDVFNGPTRIYSGGGRICGCIPSQEKQSCWKAPVISLQLIVFPVEKSSNCQLIDPWTFFETQTNTASLCSPCFLPSVVMAVFAKLPWREYMSDKWCDVGGRRQIRGAVWTHHAEVLYFSLFDNEVKPTLTSVQLVKLHEDQSRWWLDY